jgi:hypothetical protein
MKLRWVDNSCIAMLIEGGWNVFRGGCGCGGFLKQLVEVEGKAVGGGRKNWLAFMVIETCQQDWAGRS